MPTQPVFRTAQRDATDTSSILLRSVELRSAADACIGVLADIHAELKEDDVDSGEGTRAADKGAAPGGASTEGAVPGAGGQGQPQQGLADQSHASPEAESPEAAELERLREENRLLRGPSPPARSGAELWAKSRPMIRMAARAAIEFNSRAAQVSYARERVADVFQRLQVFDTTLLDLNRCNAFKPCVPLVKSRHFQCVELLPIIAEILKIQRARAKVLEERMARLLERMEAVQAARGKEEQAHKRAIEMEASGKPFAAAAEDSPKTRCRSGSSDSSRERKQRSESTGSGSDQADREALKINLRTAIAEFSEMFNLGGDGPVFGEQLVSTMGALAEFHRLDSDTLSVIATADMYMYSSSGSRRLEADQHRCGFALENDVFLLKNDAFPLKNVDFMKIQLRSCLRPPRTVRVSFDTGVFVVFATDPDRFCAEKSLSCFGLI